MKKLMLLPIMLLSLSCTKTEVKPTTEEQKAPETSYILGKWGYESDTRRYFTVDSLTDSFIHITFPRPIEGPGKSPVSLAYDVRRSGDTVFCTIPNIYPCCYFINNNKSGFAVEYMKVPTQGQYQPLLKL